MTYQLVKFQYKHFSYSRAEVIHLPNWFERNILRKSAQMVTYIGWVDCWQNDFTYDYAPYAVKNLLLTAWHNADSEYYTNDVLPRLREATKKFIETLKFLKGNEDNN